MRFESTLTSHEQIDAEAARNSLESRPFVQKTEVFGRSYAFEYPRNTGNYCIVKCTCGWLCKMNPEKTTPAFENHWLITTFHRDLNFRENRRPLRIWEILEQHTYRVEDATPAWVAKNNRQLIEDKNATKTPGGSQAPHATPQTSSSTQPTSSTKPGSGTKPATSTKPASSTKPAFSARLIFRSRGQGV